MDNDQEPVVVEVDRVHVVPGGGTHELSPVASCGNIQVADEDNDRRRSHSSCKVSD